jgi:hypothetical protein
MEWAMGYGATTRQGSGGYGLPTMLDYVKKINGSLYIISGNAACLLENNIMGPLSRPLPKILRVPSDRTVLSSEAPKVELIRNLIA